LEIADCSSFRCRCRARRRSSLPAPLVVVESSPRRIVVEADTELMEEEDMSSWVQGRRLMPHRIRIGTPHLCEWLTVPCYRPWSRKHAASTPRESMSSSPRSHSTHTSPWMRRHAVSRGCATAWSSQALLPSTAEQCASTSLRAATTTKTLFSIDS
jgi:hypothetical protein